MPPTDHMRFFAKAPGALLKAYIAVPVKPLKFGETYLIELLTRR